MKAIDLSDHLARMRISHGVEEMVPFIFVASHEPEMVHQVVWMEYFPEPFGSDPPHFKPVPKEQTLENYRSLPLIDLGNGLNAREAVMVKPDVSDDKLLLVEARYKGHYFAGVWYESPP